MGHTPKIRSSWLGTERLRRSDNRVAQTSEQSQRMTAAGSRHMTKPVTGQQLASPRAQLEIVIPRAQSVSTTGVALAGHAIVSKHVIHT